jgi:hypothetical protein
MATARKTSRRRPSDATGKLERVGEALVRLASLSIDRFGWPGFSVLLGYLFVAQYASLEQKRELIDRWVLGKDLTQWYPLLVLGVVAMLIILAQDRVWRRRLKTEVDERERLSQWKSAHQHLTLGVELQHTNPLADPKGRK